MKSQRVFSSEKIQRGILQAAKKVAFDSKDSKSVFICLDEGGKTFFSHFLNFYRAFRSFYADGELFYKCHLKVSSYKDGKSTGECRIYFGDEFADVLSEIFSKNLLLSNFDIYIVDDLIDSGLTVNSVKAWLNSNYKISSQNIKTITLVKKLAKADYSALSLPEKYRDSYIYGFGMDTSNGLKRGLNEIRIETPSLPTA